VKTIKWNTDIVKGLVVNLVGNIGMLEEGMNAKNGAIFVKKLK